jgi:hypothetical protein
MPQTFNLNPFSIHEFLEANQQIALIWSVEDVQSIRPDLDREQSWEVLQACKRYHDCEHGLTWDTLSWMADHLFSPKESS